MKRKKDWVKDREQPPESLKINPNRVQRIGLSIPKVEYRVVKCNVMDEPFTGHVTAIPTVLIFYLNATELKIVAAIIQEIMENGECMLTSKQFSTRLCASHKCVYGNLYNLRRMGLLFEERHGRKVRRSIDFQAVQYLNDIVEIEDRGIYRRLRDVVKFKNIHNISKDDLKRSYDKYVLPVDHDPEEEEEYD